MSSPADDFNPIQYPVQPPVPLRALSKIPVASQYVTMRDGATIAVTRYLPPAVNPSKILPTIMMATRYHRQGRFTPLARLLYRKILLAMMRHFVANGYAWVSVDARGSGASTGYRSGPFSHDEVDDYLQVLDWITQQPWSDGNVGLTGVSYNGTTAEMIAARGHPAVKACIPRFSLFDIYADIVYPGGVHLSWFTENWGEGTKALDANGSRFWWARLLNRGVLPMDGDDGAQLRAAIDSHRHNWHVYHTALATAYRGDWFPHLPGISMDDYSPHSYIQGTQDSGVAMYSYGGWYDGAYPRSCITRFLTLSNPDKHLILGPWNHGGSHNCSPIVGKPTQFNHGQEMIRFFDTYVKGQATGMRAEKRVQYYTLVEEKWKSSDTWDTGEDRLQHWYLVEDGKLRRDAPQESDAFDNYRITYESGTGDKSRWNSLIGGGQVIYPDRRDIDKALLTYTSAPLERDMEVTGHPLVTLYVSVDAPDIQLFVYLEDVHPDGRVDYVTEGLLRALHRHESSDTPPYTQYGPHRTYRREDAAPLVTGEVTRLHFDILPTSYLFKAGHRLRVAIAGADKDHFAVATIPPPAIRLHRTVAYPSAVHLPVMHI